MRPTVWFGYVAAWLVGDVLRIRRAHVEEAMERAGVRDPSRTARAMYRQLGRSLFELLTLALGGRSTPVAFPEDALARIAGRGGVVATAHTASWDIVACALAERVPLTVVTKSLHIGLLNSIWQRTRRQHGVNLIVVPSLHGPERSEHQGDRAEARGGRDAPHDQTHDANERAAWSSRATAPSEASTRGTERRREGGGHAPHDQTHDADRRRSGRASIPAALRRGELVAMLVDQAPERTRATIRASFLGAAACVDLAPALCALRARVPIIAAFPLRLPDGSLTVHVAGVIEPPEAPSRRWAEDAMRQITDWLDELVRKHPEQWLWMHRRWKAAPAAAPAPCPGSGAEVSGGP